MTKTHGGLILCGGRSTRMGLSKATLPFGPELMLPRVARLLLETVERVIVVAAPEQELPELPRELIVTRDNREGRGPLEGLAAGLAAASNAGLAAVYVTSCDVPLLSPGFVRRMFDLLGDHEIAVPRDAEHHHPLSAVYRVGVLPRVLQLIAEDRMRPFFLFELCDTREVATAEWRDVDPESRTLMNLNHPSDYLAALATAGLTAPEEVLRQLK